MTGPGHESDVLLVARLVAAGRISAAQLHAALDVQRRRGSTLPLGEVLQSQGILGPGELAPPSSSAPPDEVPPEVAGALGDPSRRIGRYVLLAELGRGGMGAVHRGWDLELHRLVAIKTLLDPSIRDEQRERFLREARVAARLRHPGIVTVHEVGVQGDRPYLVMDLVEGRALSALRRDELTPRRIAELVRTLAEAVEVAHREGVIHRDVKPDNILIDADGAPRLTDFGLARDASTARQLTVTGQVLGTPSYMAPEQADGDSTSDARTDVYAIGGVLYWGLVGRPPFDGPTPLAVIKQLLFQDPEPPRRIDPTVNADLETIALRCLEKEPERRYGSAKAVVDELDRFLDGRAILARPDGAIGRARRWTRRHRATAALLVLLGALGVSSFVGAFVVWRQARAAEKAARVAEARREADAARDAFREVAATAVTREELDEALACGLASVEAAASLAREAGEAGAPRLGDELLAVAAFARRSEQWSVAAGLVDRAAELGVPAAAGAHAALDAARVEREKERQAAVEEILGRAATGALTEAAQGIDDAVYDLLRHREDATARQLIVALDGVTAELRAVFREVLIEGDAAAPISELEHAITAELEPRETVDTGSIPQLIRAQARVELAAAADRRPNRRWPAIVAQRQVAAVGPRHDLAEVCFEALSRLELLPGDAADAIARYLFAEMDEAVAARAATAMLRLEPATGLDRVAVVRSRFESGGGGRFDRAMQTVLGTRGLAPPAPAREDDPRAQLQRGTLLLDQRDFAGAIRVFDRVLELEPRNGKALVDRGIARFQTGDLDGAIADLDAALALDPMDTAALSNRGIVWGQKGDRARAEADLDRAVALAPDDAGLRYARGELRRGFGELQGAAEDLLQAVRLDRSHAHAWSALAGVCWAQGKRAEALRCADEGVRLAPESAPVWQNRGVMRAQSGDVPGALEDLDRAIRLDPDEPKLRWNRGRFRLQAGDAVGAADDLGRAIDGGFHVYAYFDRARARVALGDRLGAIADLREYLRRAPPSAARTQAERLLAELGG